MASELEPVAAALSGALHLGEPFRDPGVSAFGLENAVFALGDCFLEVVAPTQANTAAGRYLDRYGDGGYMVIFDLEDLDGARARAREASIRVVWQIDLPDISGTHLHPADMRGAIVSLDASRPYGSWRWGGPDWTGQIGSRAAGSLDGVTVSVADPQDTAARWAEVLGVAPSGDEDLSLSLDGGEVRFAQATTPREERITEITVRSAAHTDAEPATVELGGVLLRLL